MRFRFFFLVAALAVIVLGPGNSSAARAMGDQAHNVTVVNHTDACVHVRLYRDEARRPTVPPVKEHDLVPRASFSVSVSELPEDVFIQADIMSDTICTNKKVAAYMESYARGGRVILAGKRLRYVFISGAL